MKHNYLIKFSAVFSFFCLATIASAQTNYSVTPIPHQVYTMPNQALIPSMDDQYSSVINIGFGFTYFGNTYNQMVVSTNGYIDFRTSLANTTSPWQISGTFPNISIPIKNSIMGSFHDMYNNGSNVSSAAISYAIVGSAPYRKFVVLFSNQPQYNCTTLLSSFQIILYETLNIIDVQIIDKPICTAWNSGRATLGIVDQSGTTAIIASGKNNTSWMATQEGWRFKLPSINQSNNFIFCDIDNDGTETFDLTVINSGSSNNTTFYQTLADAENELNALSPIYTVASGASQTIFALNDNIITPLNLSIINCSVDYDLDQVPTISEDLNQDGNLANDDTDGDGIPDFLDNDDDGDMILTSVEYVFANQGRNLENSLIDTDGDGIPNYLDNDDDGDGVLTINEDYNQNNNPADDDTNNNGLPDYLESAVALGLEEHNLNQIISLYPNPATTILNVENHSGNKIASISIYSITGALVKEVKNQDEIKFISVSELQNGIYFLKVKAGNQISNSKFVKN
ncbi:T9SS type A sorting domain-containing protein [Flavobacterium sp. NST-5]|uniref:T9SS type A sorting domain-containing protein n=1 Tax=Flavobacterium ichthyis TaxID=2698827 RepID=A0ABW9Z8G6_9FLAO|nr:T9SS type A sorting domain-containing protein [Flavobacterium ichthyis]NBL64867.1 T9SS type A sorting domain-containing protein [Flavobacterium ichthyis]